MKYKYIQKRKEGEARKRGKKGEKEWVYLNAFFMGFFFNCYMKKEEKKSFLVFLL
jgi:hypothetical protein